VKNSFPVDIFENNFILNIRRYNDRNSFENNGFWKVLDSLNEKIRQLLVEKFDAIKQQINKDQVILSLMFKLHPSCKTEIITRI